MIDWNVFARQIALIFIPVLLAKLSVPAYLVDIITGPLADLLATVIVAAGFGFVGWIVYLGQRREQPAAKIEAVSELKEVTSVKVKSDELADSLGPKVVS